MTLRRSLMTVAPFTTGLCYVEAVNMLVDAGLPLSDVDCCAEAVLAAGLAVVHDEPCPATAMLLPLSESDLTELAINIAVGLLTEEL